MIQVADIGFIKVIHQGRRFYHMVLYSRVPAVAVAGGVQIDLDDGVWNAYIPRDNHLLRAALHNKSC